MVSLTFHLKQKKHKKIISCAVWIYISHSLSFIIFFYVCRSRPYFLVCECVSIWLWFSIWEFFSFNYKEIFSYKWTESLRVGARIYSWKIPECILIPLTAFELVFAVFDIIVIWQLLLGLCAVMEKKHCQYLSSLHLEKVWVIWNNQAKIYLQRKCFFFSYRRRYIPVCLSWQRGFKTLRYFFPFSYFLLMPLQ